MTIGIVGLGLIGGSLAKAFKYSGTELVLGTDILESVVLKAKLLGAIDRELLDTDLAKCDLVIVALYPKATVEYVKSHAHQFKKGAIVIDTCGIKEDVCTPLFETAKQNDFTFIGTHPMAGIAFSGFEHSTVTMFKNASMIIVPPKGIDISLLDNLKKVFLSIGFTNIQITSAKEHDRIIAYTSQLAHVVSNAYVKSPSAEVHCGFSAGSYKDLTRVAKLNPDMWTELFMENKENLATEIDGIIENLKLYSQAIKENNAAKLYTLLKVGSERKDMIDGYGKNCS